MKILAVGAHLDDIEIAAGGTLAKAIDYGHEVKALIMSRSGYTNREGSVQRTDEDAVKEGICALHILGIQNIEILEFPTKDIPFESDALRAFVPRTHLLLFASRFQQSPHKVTDRHVVCAMRRVVESVHCR